MPITAAWIDELRRVFGADEITLAMREGLADGSFWAIEGEHVVGSPPHEAYRRLGREPGPEASPYPEAVGYPCISGNIKAP